MTGWRPLRDVRARLLAIVLVALALALGAATYGFNVLFAHTSSRDANTLLRTRADSELALLDLRNGRLHVEETNDDLLGDSNIWVFAGARAIETPRARPEVAEAARALAPGPSRFVDVRESDTRLYSTPVVIGGRRVGTLVTGLSLAPYEQTRKSALVGSLALAALLLGLVGIAVYLLLRSALSPVARMTAQAAAWSEHDLDRRFELGDPHDELTRLAATLDGLLDRLAASLRHERRFSAEISHELRTPLAKLIAEAELALRRERSTDAYREAIAIILRNGLQLARTVETLVAAAQQELAPRGTADGYAAAAEVVEACARAAGERGIRIAVEKPAQPVRVGVDADIVERILQPLVENACRYGHATVGVAIRRARGGVEFLVEDDGPGIDSAERDAIFEPGTRGAAGRRDGEGAGLGLALARRLARGAAGDIEAQAGDGGRFVVTLPAA
ncbi:MAG TPA: ATP-binding protein [Gaiellaceae bacterium]|nr:ATP-binding protein [Gaiellaceae bacterium]